jgi:quinol monooxygenase YgiN
VVLSVRVVAPEEKRDDILRSLRLLVGPASAETACAACGVYQDSNDANSITFIQAWSNHEDLQRHVRSHQHRQFLSVLDLSHTASDVRLDNVGKRKFLSIRGEYDSGRRLGHAMRTIKRVCYFSSWINFSMTSSFERSLS